MSTNGKVSLPHHDTHINSGTEITNENRVNIGNSNLFYSFFTLSVDIVMMSTELILNQ